MILNQKEQEVIVVCDLNHQLFQAFPRWHPPVTSIEKRHCSSQAVLVDGLRLRPFPKGQVASGQAFVGHVLSKSRYTCFKNP